ncbi:carboxylesterase family protein [Streptomyces sp. NPDC001743]|uniref:carboxylesterase/lipase family protein n=1 Tax=Streptomyces sp. NPDC001743 TaxID=3154397 RepID=UPI00332A02BF
MTSIPPPRPRRRVGRRAHGIRLLRVAVLLAVTAVSVTTAAAEPPRADGVRAETVVRTDHGLIRGAAHGSYVTFDGIPYAAPPTGRLRWQEPAPAPAWRGVRDATAPASRCVQMPMPGMEGVSGSEDCLYLNVTAPSARPPAGERRPVLVWLHGGAFLGGSGGDYGAERLAVRGDTLVVTVNYRLGVFGYFGHRALGSAPPFGLADQQAALRWVRANVERFGGDPGAVTLFGESAGALSVCAHLTSPRAAGLFQRAVLQSGSCLMSFPPGALGPGTPAYEPFAPAHDVQDNGARAAAQLGCASSDDARVLACLREQSTEHLATTQLMQSFNRPAFGNSLLPTAPGEALASGRFHRVPLLQGTNHDEMRMFVGQSLTAYPLRTEEDYRARLDDTFGPAGAAVASHYPAARYPTPALAWSAALTDRSLTCTTLQAAREITTKAPRLPLYGYEFNDPDAPVLTGLPAHADLPYGAAHGFELPYLFSSVPTQQPLNEAQDTLSDRMIDYWASFAHTGNPNTPGAPRWPVLRTTGPVLSLAPGPGAIHASDAYDAHHCAFWHGTQTGVGPGLNPW